MKTINKFNSVTGAEGGRKSSRLGVRNKSKKVQINKEILQLLHDNKGNLDSMFTNAMEQDSIKAMTLFLAMMEIVFTNKEKENHE